MEQSAVFGDICKINHNCSPNATWFWDNLERRMSVVAVRAIKRGEEISISYLPFDETDGVDERRRQLGHWGFVCQCEKCVIEEARG